MARDNHCLLGSKLLAPLNNLLDWLRQEPGKLLLKTKVSCGCLSHSGFSMNKADRFFAPLYCLSLPSLTDTMMTVYFLQTAWLMRFQFFSNTKIICCGLVINRSNSKYHYQFRERVEQETLSKQFNPLEHATAKKLHCTPYTKYRLLLCHTQFCHNNVSDATDHPPALMARLWLTMTRHSSLLGSVGTQRPVSPLCLTLASDGPAVAGMLAGSSHSALTPHTDDCDTLRPLILTTSQHVHLVAPATL